MWTIAIEPLTRDAFAPFCCVVAADGADPIQINQGFAERFDTSAGIDVLSQGGAVNVSLFTANPRPLPVAIALMERHPLGSQLFFPLQDRPWLVVVCADPRVASSFRAFAATGRQGVNYARDTWHHPLLVHDRDSRFLVVDRRGTGQNLEEMRLGDNPLVLSPLVPSS